LDVGALNVIGPAAIIEFLISNFQFRIGFF
jgi:hypothetical protein